MGVVILKVKEVTPERIPQRFSTFWHEHVSRHRRHLRSLRGSVKAGRHQRKENTLSLLEEVREVLQSTAADEAGLEDTFLQTLFEKAQRDSDYVEILKWTGKPAPNKNNMALHRFLSRTYTQNNDVEKSILDVLRGSKRFNSKTDFVSNPSNIYARSNSQDNAKVNNVDLYNQAKMIQRSKTIDVSKRRQIFSKRRKRVQMKLRGTEDTRQHKNDTERSNDNIILQPPEVKQELSTNTDEREDDQSDCVKTNL